MTFALRDYIGGEELWATVEGVRDLLGDPDPPVRRRLVLRSASVAAIDREVLYIEAIDPGVEQPRWFCLYDVVILDRTATDVTIEAVLEVDTEFQSMPTSPPGGFAIAEAPDDRGPDVPLGTCAVIDGLLDEPPRR